MNDVESVKSLVPKYKQQLIFLRERKKVFDVASSIDENKENKTIEECTTHATEFSFPRDYTPLASSTLNSTHTSSSYTEETSVDEPKSLEIPIIITPDITSDSSQRPSLPADYSLPSLPPSLSKDIDNGAIEKFNAHCKNRQILIDGLFYDLTINHNIWYVKNHQAKTTRSV
jgi:hypothetical protein